jgi:methylase of polypeptide subunit release factors
MILERTLTALRRRIARPLVNGLRRPFVLRRIRRPSEVRLLGYRFRTDPQVFHPVCFSSSRLLAEHLLERSLRGVRLLDMGTGAGPIAVVSAAAGALVTACDVNPRAVLLARQNVVLNGLTSEVLESNLFAALAGRSFDLICFNVPFYSSDPANHFEAAYKAGRNLETVRRFAAGCGKHLEANGSVVILFSEDSDGGGILRAFTDAGFFLENRRVIREMLEDFHLATFKLGASTPRSA